MKTSVPRTPLVRRDGTPKTDHGWVDYVKAYPEAGMLRAGEWMETSAAADVVNAYGYMCRLHELLDRINDHWIHDELADAMLPLIARAAPHHQPKLLGNPRYVALFERAERLSKEPPAEEPKRKTCWLDAMVKGPKGWHRS